MKPLSTFFIIAIIFAIILSLLAVTSHDLIERADLVICKRENGWRKEKSVIPVDSVSENFIVSIDWSVFNKSNCEVLEKCARIESYRTPSDEIETGDIVWFTCTGNIIYPEKV